MQIYNSTELIEYLELYNDNYHDMFDRATLQDLSIIHRPMVLTEYGQSPQYQFLVFPDSVTEPKTFAELMDETDLVNVLAAVCRFDPINTLDDGGKIIWARWLADEHGHYRWVMTGANELVFAQMRQIFVDYPRMDDVTHNVVEDELRDSLRIYLNSILTEWTNRIKYQEQDFDESVIPETELSKIIRKSKRLRRGSLSGKNISF